MEQIIKIGTALKWRGDYSSSATYYKDNVITMHGCIYLCIVNSVTNFPPCGMDEETGHYCHINKSKWVVMLDNLDVINGFKLPNDVEVVQETGGRRDKVMSQKAVTDTLMKKFDKDNIIVLSEDEYDSLSEIDSDKFYFVYEEE